MTISSVFSTSHQLSETLRPRIANQLVCAEPKNFHSSLKSNSLGENCHLALEKHRSLSGILQPKADAYFTFPRDEARMFCNGQEMSFAKNPLAFQVHHTSRVSDFAYQSPLSFYSLYVNQAYFSRVYETLTQESVDGLLDLQTAHFTSAATRKNIFKQLADELKSPKDDPQTESAILESFITSLDLKRPTEPIAYCNRMAQKAHEIIIATPGRRISLTEICKELKVASRSLQKGFTEVYGMGFTEYHQLYRLHKLRSYLRKNGVEFGDLTNIMSFFGFNHAGRLSQYYKQTFGVLPSKESKAKSSEVRSIFKPSYFS